jgi:membrane-associated phospholipid phosphatase
MKRLTSLLIVLILFGLGEDLQAQSRRVRRARAKTLRMEMSSSARISVDTPEIFKGVFPLAAQQTDTTRRDTSSIEQVAQVIHDSIKAQLKAPIVQVPVTLRSLIVPGALFAYGAITLNRTDLRVINEQARDWVWNGEKYSGFYIENYGLFAPAVAVYALNIFGVKGQNNLVDRSIIYGMSNLISNGIVFGVKQFGISRRPDASDDHSFPSGHTAQAFVSAEFFHQEYKGRVHWTAIAGGYAVATWVGYMRMYHNKHWLNDVVAGAGVGIASTRFAYYLYPVFKNWIFGSRKVREDAMIFPMYQNTGSGNVYGLSLSYKF